MARPTSFLIEKLREAAGRIESADHYNWGNPARCNCGHLAQSILSITSQELYQTIRAQSLDEWTEYGEAYCPLSGTPVDTIMGAMFDAGLELRDIHQLEYLANQRVLAALPGGFRHLRKGYPRDVALYLRTWAGLMELELKERESQVPVLA